MQSLYFGKRHSEDINGSATHVGVMKRGDRGETQPANRHNAHSNGADVNAHMEYNPGANYN